MCQFVAPPRSAGAFHPVVRMRGGHRSGPVKLTRHDLEWDGKDFKVAVAEVVRKPPRPRLDWATLHTRTFGTDVLRCPCGGRRTVRSLHLTRKAAEERLAALGVHLPSRLLP